MASSLTILRNHISRTLKMQYKNIWNSNTPLLNSSLSSGDHYHIVHLPYFSKNLLSAPILQFLHSILNSTQLNSTQLNSTQLNSTQLNSTELNSSSHLNSTQLNSTQLNSTSQLNSTELNSTSSLNSSSHLNSTLFYFLG